MSFAHAVPAFVVEKRMDSERNVSCVNIVNECANVDNARTRIIIGGRHVAKY